MKATKVLKDYYKEGKQNYQRKYQPKYQKDRYHNDPEFRAERIAITKRAQLRSKRRKAVREAVDKMIDQYGTELVASVLTKDVIDLLAEEDV